jgi:hypothetical protein
LKAAIDSALAKMAVVGRFEPVADRGNIDRLNPQSVLVNRHTLPNRRQFFTQTKCGIAFNAVDKWFATCTTG